MHLKLDDEKFRKMVRFQKYKIWDNSLLYIALLTQIIIQAILTNNWTSYSNVNIWILSLQFNACQMVIIYHTYCIPEYKRVATYGYLS